MERQDRQCRPTLAEFGDSIQNPVFWQFYTELKHRYPCTETIEYSSCSMEKGWNLKLKKAGRTLCTIYPRASYFTVMVVIGRKERARVDAILPSCTIELQELFSRTREGNGQKWLMMDIEGDGGIYPDVLRLIEIRAG